MTTAIQDLKRLARDLKQSAFREWVIRPEDSDIGYLISQLRYRNIIFDPVNPKFKALVEEVYGRRLTPDELYEEAKTLKKQEPGVMNIIFKELEPYITKKPEPEAPEDDSANTFDFGSGERGARRHKNPDGTLGGWVADSALVEPTAYVERDALVFNEAKVLDQARILGTSQIYDTSEVHDQAKVFGNAVVCGEAMISENAEVYGDAQVSGVAYVHGKARVFGKADVSGGEIHGTAKVNYDFPNGIVDH